MIVYADIGAQPALGAALDSVLRLLDLRLVAHSDGAVLPGSYWGEPEAGITGRSVNVRPDTPLHSLLHESCHIACAMQADIYRDAGGSDTEEAAVCVLQLKLSEALPGIGSARLCEDMDTWGYSFREGSARGFIEGDGVQAAQWLREHRPEVWRTLVRLGVEQP